MHLTGSTADIVRQTFGTTANNAVAATVAVVISFLFWGIGSIPEHNRRTCRSVMS
jgi:hypothetical protein